MPVLRSEEELEYLRATRAKERAALEREREAARARAGGEGGLREDEVPGLMPKIQEWFSEQVGILVYIR